MENNDNDNTQSFVPLVKGTEVGHYTIIEKIGAGGMGEVYLAEDTKLKRKVALKFLSPHLSQDEDCRKRFTREAQAAAGLDHPNIAGIHEVGEYNGRPFYSMQVVEGQSLREVIMGKDLPIERIIEMAIQACEGLQAAHDKGIIHRDIKPSNILIDGHGRVRIVDFGLASIPGSEHLTKTGSTLGTIGYMSPEQVRGEEIDHRSDLFSLGVLLYELLSRQNPFSRDNEAATLKAVCDDTPHPLARFRHGVPDLLETVVAKLLEKKPAHRYQNASGVVSDLKRLERDSGSTITSSSTRKISNRTMRLYFPLIVVILGVTALVLKPWKFEIRPDDVALASENRLAIMYFDNLIDPTDSLKLGEIVTNLLITDLSESKYVQVVSGQRLYDILKQLGRESQKRIDRSVATQVAEKAKARWMLLGSILNTEPEIIIAAQLIEVASGDAIASQRIEGQPGERIFTLVDSLTIEIKNDLSLPARALEEEDRPIMDVTTHSTEAYRYYLKGVECGFKFYFKEAKDYLTKALEYDSTFAMAYYRLAGIVGRPLRDSLTAKAVKYAMRSGKREQYIIHSFGLYEQGKNREAIEYVKKKLKEYPDDKEAYYIMGHIYSDRLDQPRMAIPYFNSVIELDPFYKLAYNSLAYTYEKLGNFDKSIWAINKYIEIAPDEANPYDTRADLYSHKGDLKQAIASYEQALKIKPDFFASKYKLAHLYLFTRDYEKADSSYREFCTDSDPFRRSLGRLYLVYVPLHQGKLDEALRTLDDMVTAGRIEQDKRGEADFHHLRARIFEEKNELETALTETEKATEEFFKTNPDDVNYFRLFYILLLAKNEDIEKARSECEMIRDKIEKHDSSTIWTYWYALGLVEFAQGNYEESIPHFKKALEDKNYFSNHYMLGLSYLMAGRLGEAVSWLESTLNRYDASRVGSTIWSVKIHYYLGQAYEASGWNGKAIEQYETFLDIWKNADEGLKSVADARQRLAKIKNKS